jgi:hypothetical protein
MAGVKNLLTLADISAATPGYSIDAHLYAVLTDGNRLILRDDRGWASAFGGLSASPHEVEISERLLKRLKV